ncbi:MAG: acyl-CoA thioesterase [candidate division Zixibacteria bacterium]|nr:acyl-CoA thioesterase [candidate division Zixibacteria bacterium]
MYTWDTTVKLHQTDAAGIVFYGNYFRIVHDAYEAFMGSLGFDFNYIINEADFLVLIAHAEADYSGSLRPSEKIRVQIALDKIGTTSFVLGYDVLNTAGDSVCRLKTVHVATDKKSGRKRPLPEKLRAKLVAAT